MGHAAPLPSEEHVKRVARWGEMLCSTLANIPSELSLEFLHTEKEEDAEHYPLHAFSAKHHTLPARELVIGLGIPVHGDECQCIVAARPRLTIAVYDEDTEDEIADSGIIQIDDPQHWASIAATIMVVSAAFSATGTI